MLNVYNVYNMHYLYNMHHLFDVFNHLFVYVLPIQYLWLCVRLSSDAVQLHRLNASKHSGPAQLDLLLAGGYWCDIYSHRGL